MTEWVVSRCMLLNLVWSARGHKIWLAYGNYCEGFFLFIEKVSILNKNLHDDTSLLVQTVAVFVGDLPWEVVFNFRMPYVIVQLSYP